MKNNKAVSINQDNKIFKSKKTIIASLIASSFFSQCTFANVEIDFLNLIKQSDLLANNQFIVNVITEEAETSFATGGNGGNGGNGIGVNPGNSGIAGTGTPPGTQGGNGGGLNFDGAGGIDGGEGGSGFIASGEGGLGAFKGGNGGSNISGGGGGGGGSSTNFLTGQGTGGGGGGGSNTSGAGGGGGGGGVGQTFLFSPVEIGENTGGNGGNGGNASLDAGGGGGGGGGTAVVFNTVISNATNSFNNIGGNGGNGGSSLGGGGGGGGGGTGMLFNEAVNLTNISNIIGGNGGLGGIGGGDSGGITNSAGNGGSGGDGIDIFAFTSSQLNNIGNIIGGNGGDGGESLGAASIAGNGGSGGFGLLFIENNHIINNGLISGGAGGSGGDVASQDATPGNGGEGGVGIEAIGGGVLVNAGMISGGNGGVGGSSPTSASGFAGAGGVAIMGGNLNIINRGTIEGGFVGDHIGNELFRAPAIVFLGGVNRLELQPGFSISGLVIGCDCGDDVLALGGSGSATFDVGLLSTGGQYLNFTNYEKTGDSTWTLIGSLPDPSIVTPWTINQGILSISDDAQLGNAAGLLTLNGGILQTTSSVMMDRLVTLAAAGGTFNTLANLNINNTINGSGSLIKTGPGALISSAVNTYTGPTIIAEGTLALELAGDVASSSGINLVNTNTVFDITNANDNRVIQLLSGVAGSTVNVGATHLIINQVNTSFFAGEFVGTEGFTKQGLGSLILTGASTNYGGNVSIEAGSLIVNGVLSSQVTIGTNGRLGGTGTVGTTEVNGIIAPGNYSIGVLTVAGNYTQTTGSVYEVEINTAGQSDLINVTGTANLLPGANVYVLKESGLYAAGTRYTILTAGGGVNGTYNNLLQNLPFLNLILNYDASNVYLDVARNDRSFAFFGTTLNEIATATGVESLGAGNPLYNGFLNLDNVPLIKTTLNNLSGEIYPSTLGALLEESRYIRDAISMRLDDQANFLPHVKTITGLIFWAHGFGTWGKLDGNYNASELDRSTQGFFIGADQEVGVIGRVGLVGGYSRSNFDVDRRNSFSESNNGHIGLYANAFYNRFIAHVGAAYSWHDINTNRSVSFPYFNDYLTNNYNANTAQVFGELGYDLQVNRFSIKPLVNIAYIDVSSDRFKEHGGAASLRARQASQDMTYTTLGIREKGVLYVTDTYALNQRIFLGWRHAYNSLTPQATLNFASGSLPFLIGGTPLARNALLLDAGIDIARLANDVHLNISYFGQFASRVKDNGFVARLTWSFDGPALQYK
ncbi:Extracellular serine protease precursor [Legionella busanensis]|uniref:Extracellular serine protease n=1 Tax=Legionella busanensis TaxID=190655 RepID=A0A378JNI9_9GAMM|nr:autotransporter domain-containing protein [Legionella busanensis]STX52815.1 Extracellular serine protease precursor [Legionella busanensis]